MYKGAEKPLRSDRRIVHVLSALYMISFRFYEMALNQSTWDNMAADIQPLKINRSLQTTCCTFLINQRKESEMPYSTMEP